MGAWADIWEFLGLAALSVSVVLAIAVILKDVQRDRRRQGSR